jgi:hypothetical protein
VAATASLPTDFPVFGGIWFSHEGNSTITGSKEYGGEILDQCKAAASFLDYNASCGRFGGIGYVLQYNFTAIHGILVFENIATTAIGRLGANNTQLNVQTTISPLPISRLEENLFHGEHAMIAWFLLLIAFPFISGSFAVFIMNEKSSKTKHLQIVSGVDRLTYWFSTFVWDMASYQIPLWSVVILLLIFNVEPFTKSDNDSLAGVILLLMFHGPAAAGFTYCLTHAFSSTNACHVFVVVIGFFIGMGGKSFVCRKSGIAQ